MVIVHRPCESCGRYFATTTSAEAESESEAEEDLCPTCRPPDKPGAHAQAAPAARLDIEVSGCAQASPERRRRLPGGEGRGETAYERRESDPGFARAWDEAIECAVDDLVGEAWRRASFGTERPVFYQGEACGEVTEYSDGLLMFLLAHRRGVYGDRSQVEVAGPEGGGPLQAVIYLPSNGRDDTPPAGTPGDVAL